MIYLLLGTGFEVTEAMVPLVMMRRAGIDVCTVGINGKTVVGSRDIPIVADITIEEMDLTNLEGIVLPGGLGGVASIKASQPALDAVRFAWENGKLVAAICAAPTALAAFGVLGGKKATVYPGMDADLTAAGASYTGLPITIDGNIITGEALGAAIPFALALARTLAGADAANKVKTAIVYQ